MHADELADISATLIAAIADARAHAQQCGIDDEFRTILQHAMEMRDLLGEFLKANESLLTARLVENAEFADIAIAQLEALTTGKMR